MRLRTVSSIILPSAHKVKASARNSVTTVVGGRERCSGGLLKESPEPPRTFLKFFIGGGGVAVPKGGLPPAGGVPLRGTCSPCRCRTRRGLNPGGTGSLCPGGEDHLKRRRRLRRIVPSPPVPPLLGCRHCSPVPRPNRNAPAGCHQRRGKAPLRAPAWQGYKCRVGSGVGMQGAEPLA